MLAPSSPVASQDSSLQLLPQLPACLLSICQLGGERILGLACSLHAGKEQDQAMPQ